MKLVDEFIKAVLGGSIQQEVQVAPACSLARSRSAMGATMPRLQEEMPELLILGDYKPETRTGRYLAAMPVSATGSESSRTCSLSAVSRQIFALSKLRIISNHLPSCVSRRYLIWVCKRLDNSLAENRSGGRDSMFLRTTIHGVPCILP